MINKILAIFSGIFFMIFQKIEKEILARKRIKICKACPKMQTGSRTKLKICSICGCFIESKVRQNIEDCPLKKWTVMKNQKPQKVRFKVVRVVTSIITETYEMTTEEFKENIQEAVESKYKNSFCEEKMINRTQSNAETENDPIMLLNIAEHDVTEVVEKESVDKALYSVVIPEIYETKEDFADKWTVVVYDGVWSCSSEPFHPQGIGTYIGEIEKYGDLKGFGKKIKFESAPEDVQKFALQKLKP